MARNNLDPNRTSMRMSSIPCWQNKPRVSLSLPATHSLTGGIVLAPCSEHTSFIVVIDLYKARLGFLDFNCLLYSELETLVWKGQLQGTETRHTVMIQGYFNSCVSLKTGSRKRNVVCLSLVLNTTFGYMVQRFIVYSHDEKKAQWRCRCWQFSNKQAE